MIEARIPFEWAERQAMGAVRQGLSLDRLLSESLITRQYGDHRDTITHSQYLLLCLNTLVGIEDASQGLARSALGMSYPAIGARLVQTYPSLESALLAICRLYSMASNAVRFQLKTEEDASTISVHVDSPDDQDAIVLEEVMMGWIFMLCLHFLGRQFHIFRVTVRAPAHFNLGHPHWALGATVQRGNQTSFSFPRALLAAPPRKVEGSPLWQTHTILLKFAEDSLSDPSLSDYVSGSGFIRFADIVRDTGSSANTVRHRLQAHGKGFREARQHTLVNAALKRLRLGDDSIEAIAADLGYSDGRSFRRFLKNATGKTPNELRLSQTPGNAPDQVLVLEKLRAMVAKLDP